ncbi:CAZyme family GH128 [Penicillium taxi]|uniref:CAZyme family GH128 n=1 Tax=Penicillium taxi TaxID=168475 RepID=UPI00254549BF|nr:CAZyme family GH128 [Penicillium taxi]KAJ5908836.1 CAZyme family GH128 [Penicillium taxi]
MVSFTNLLTAGLVASAALAAPHSHAAAHKKRSSTKRGAAYNDITTVTSLSSVTWAYNWGMTNWGLDLPKGVEYVPMLWGSKDFGGWLTAVETLLNSGTNYILGFNEPDNSGQSSMTPSEAASNYLAYITPFKGQAKLISPAVTSSTNDGEGLSWFGEFIADCSSCGITGLAVHWYGDSADQLISFVKKAVKAAAEYGLEEVWLTEFALNADVNGIADTSVTQAFLNEVVPFLESTDGITRYSYFMCADNYLLTNGALNAVGTTYLS